MTFDSALIKYTPGPFPYKQNATLIATYWADADTTSGGDVLYRESSDPYLLSQAASEVRSAFIEQAMFNATWMFIATWNNVGFFGAHGIGVQKVRCVYIFGYMQCYFCKNSY